jgi:2'-5' RNA ligase
LKSPRARLFVALDLPDPIRDGLSGWQSRALRDPALRPVKPEALHVTLCFLSYHREKAIDRILELIDEIEPRPVEMRLEPEPVPIPGGRPRLFAIGAASEAAEAVQAELAAGLEAERLYVPEKRPFWPHLTVARVRSERLPPTKGQRRGKGRPKRVSKRPQALPERLTEPFGAVRMALYRSNLKPQGAEYVRLGGVDLPSPEGDTEKR